MKSPSLTSYLISYGVLILLHSVLLLNYYPNSVIFDAIRVQQRAFFSSRAWVNAVMERLEIPSFLKKVPLLTSNSLIGSQGINLDSDFRAKNSLINQPKELFLKMGGLVKIWIRVMSTSIWRLKQSCLRLLIGHLPSPHGQLLFGMIFGGSSELPKSLRHSFEVTGMLHVLSASGYNVGLIVSLADKIWSRFWRPPLLTILSLLSLLIYVWMADATPSVVRAGLMCALQIVARQLFFLRVQAYWLLGVSVVVMVGWDSLYLESLSFQLSVSACLGILLWGWALDQNHLFDFSMGQTFFSASPQGVRALGRNMVEYFRAALLMTLSAQSLSWALQIATFHTLSLVSLLANPAAIWLTPWLTTGGLAFIVLAALSDVSPVASTFLVPLLAWPLGVASQVFLWLISLFGQWERGVLAFAETQPRWFIPAWWLGVVTLAIFIKKGRNSRVHTLYVA